MIRTKAFQVVADAGYFITASAITPWEKDIHVLEAIFVSEKRFCFAI